MSWILQASNASLCSLKPSSLLNFQLLEVSLSWIGYIFVAIMQLYGMVWFLGSRQLLLVYANFTSLCQSKIIIYLHTQLQLSANWNNSRNDKTLGPPRPRPLSIAATPTILAKSNTRQPRRSCLASCLPFATSCLALFRLRFGYIVVPNGIAWKCIHYALHFIWTEVVNRFISMGYSFQSFNELIMPMCTFCLSYWDLSRYLWKRCLHYH